MKGQNMVELKFAWRKEKREGLPKEDQEDLSLDHQNIKVARNELFFIILNVEKNGHQLQERLCIKILTVLVLLNLEIMIMGVIELINFLNLIIVKELVNIKI